MGSFVDLTGADGRVFPAWVAEPDGPARAGVVVLQEIFGVNSHIRAVVDRFAARGYVAVAPALFERVQPGVDLGYDAEGMQEGRRLKAAIEGGHLPAVLGDIQAAADHAAQRLAARGSSGRVGVVGFCWGGLLAWRAAAQVDRLAASVCYYGGGMTVGDEPARQPRVPVLAHFGRRDAHITLDTVQAFAQAQPGVEVQVYDADHGFNCDQRGSYDEAAAVAARERTLAFFTRHLEG